MARSGDVGEHVGAVKVADDVAPPRLRGEHLHLAYESFDVAEDLTVSLPTGKITSIVGPNACGKSTLLKALARLLKPRSGSVILDGEEISRIPTREVAARLGILPQTPIAPDGITVANLVARGRYPHQRWFRQLTEADEEAIATAMVATEIEELASRPVDELSGGQRQRVWIAMALAQGTDIMLLDEPTTFLDLSHQIEVLDLLAGLNETSGRTIVLVLHDLNQAARYSHHMVAMREGTLVTEGPPSAVVTAEVVERVFGMRCLTMLDPATGTPMISPLGRRQAGRSP